MLALRIAARSGSVQWYTCIVVSSSTLQHGHWSDAVHTSCRFCVNFFFWRPVFWISCWNLIIRAKPVFEVEYAFSMASSRCSQSTRSKIKSVHLVRRFKWVRVISSEAVICRRFLKLFVIIFELMNSVALSVGGITAVSRVLPSTVAPRTYIFAILSHLSLRIASTDISPFPSWWLLIWWPLNSIPWAWHSEWISLTMSYSGSKAVLGSTTRLVALRNACWLSTHIGMASGCVVSSVVLRRRRM